MDLFCNTKYVFDPVKVSISVLGVTAIVLSQWERFAQPEYRVMRAGVFLSLGLSGVIPMLHTIIKNGPKGIGYIPYSLKNMLDKIYI